MAPVVRLKRRVVERLRLFWPGWPGGRDEGVESQVGAWEQLKAMVTLPLVHLRERMASHPILHVFRNCVTKV